MKRVTAIVSVLVALATAPASAVADTAAHADAGLAARRLGFGLAAQGSPSWFNLDTRPA